MSMSKLEFDYQAALKRDDLDKVKSILSSGVSPNYMFIDGKRPTHVAILYNSENVGRYLVKCPCIDLDACDSNGTSPLFLANEINSKYFVALLVFNGAVSYEKGETFDNLCHIQNSRKKEYKKTKEQIENTRPITINRKKHLLPNIGNVVFEEKILKETSQLLELPAISEDDICDARGTRRKKICYC